ncbi:probable serine/threonine-protein kinase clkA isoform X1 [Cucurbita pepo subsp. pepo]|uniref:probable serine/threonine-protein kinase clkA isoform X1 n=1 Tax=Cucurbita pepo subsp. pepo TaxID=3664 RepID=UPI000C9D9D50|nr:probable serine/threonine-protein kinase clkA isoform X1 [Cucurbita pepo subsp. pepo]
MAVSDVEAVLEFLNKNGFSEAESALKRDVVDKSDLGSFDFEKFFFPMLPAPPPVRIPSTSRQFAALSGGDGDGEDRFGSNSVSSDDEFVSLRSSTSDVCSSEFINPYGVSSESSSDIASQFDTARDYHEFDLQNDLLWYDEKEDVNFFGCPSEDKFIMTTERTEQFSSLSAPEKSILCRTARSSDERLIEITNHPYKQGLEGLPEGCLPFCKCCVANGEFYSHKSDSQLKVVKDIATNCDSSTEIYCSSNFVHGFENHNDSLSKVLEKSYIHNAADGYNVDSRGEVEEEADESEPVADGDGVAADELPMYGINDDEFEVFDLRIIHRKNRTGFEESKDFPIVLNTVLAGRYYVTEYLGSAAFSKVIRAHDLQTGIDVCLKIIKNDKDFFDQSLDEIKLLKLVNKHDPADRCHILRLYDYFYHQEHLFIVCELLRANLYEFQKFNQESGGDAYFTFRRLQFITRQCLEALEFLHHLGIIHCDLKPENILLKSYKRCEIKVIDLGSSCFQSDNLCLYVQSRSYRAPEVILGLPYDPKIDLWSLGCILAELWSGEVLFPNDAVVMILARMIGLFGPIDLEMLLKGQETHKYFTKEYDLFYMNEENDQMEFIIPEESSLENHLQVFDSVFIDFLSNLLEINPERRPTAKEALAHPWLSQSYQ